VDGAGVVWTGVDGAVVTAAAAVVVAVATGVLGIRLLAVAIAVVGEDEEPHAATTPMTNTSPQTHKTPAITLRPCP
jgi:hypothetical protein